MSKAIVLFSGGQDSTTALLWARSMFDEVCAVSVHYGQRHRSELDAAVRIARLLGVRHIQLEETVLATLGGSALVDSSQEIRASGGHTDRAMPEGLPTSFVPGRNALLLTLAAAAAVKEGARDVVAGVCQTDYSGYPDCRQEFVDALGRALTLGLPSSCGPIRIHTPLMYLSKAETVRFAIRIAGIEALEALALSVTCYLGLRPGCANCPACVLRARGFAEAGVKDPAGVLSR